MDIKKKLDKLIKDLKKEDKNASLANFVTGVVVLVLIAIFSFWFFSRNSTEQKLFNFSTEDLNSSETIEQGLGEESNDVSKGDSNEVDEDGMVTVKKGEGLWHVAKRVCGDGESYIYLAEENGLDYRWSKLSEGQKLKVKCTE